MYSSKGKFNFVIAYFSSDKSTRHQFWHKARVAPVAIAAMLDRSIRPVNGRMSLSLRPSFTETRLNVGFDN